MLRRSIVLKALTLAFCCVAALALATTTTTIPNSAADFSGREILAVTELLTAVLIMPTCKMSR